MFDSVYDLDVIFYMRVGGASVRAPSCREQTLLLFITLLSHNHNLLFILGRFI